MISISRFVLALSLCFAVPLSAQTPTQPVTGAASVGKVDAQNLAQLPRLVGARGAISLGVTRDELEASPESLEALRDFVSRGGVVFLHTDAAQLFGFRTVTARRGSNAQGGQLLGRARAALPFGSHPLLNANRTQKSSDPSRLPGVNVVFYTLREGDILVIDHPAGTPILRVTDLTALTPNAQPLFACALAPFGKGLAVVVPEAIDSRRADGALFLANLQQLVPEAGAQTGPKWIGIPQSTFDSEVALLGGAIAEALQTPETSAPALPPLEAQTRAAPQVVPQPNSRTTSAAPVLLLERAEASAILRILGTDSASAGQAILRARVAILRGDYARAQSLLESVPDSAERAFLLGVVAGGGAAPIAQPSPDRAAFAREAASQMTRAASLRPLFASAAPSATVSNSAKVLGVEVAAIRATASEFARLAQMFSLEPPGFQVVGNGQSQIVFRFYPGDPSSPAIVPAATALANPRTFGWRVDEQEILLFPNEAAYLPFRRSTGQTAQNVPFPSAFAGDVIGSRVLLVTIPATPVIRRLPNGQPQILPPRSVGLQILARLQAYALLSTWLDGGGRVPTWLALGLENLAANAIGAETLTGNTTGALENFAQAGGLLTPAQFEAQRAAPSDLAQLQAAALASYFYRAFGAGAVSETVQRLGAGQSVSAALSETTGGDEAAFFLNWRNAQFGARNFPNRG